MAGPSASCNNGVKDGSEADVDCGGPCVAKCAAGKACGAATDCASALCTSGLCATASCTDSLKDGSESDVDCGGSCATKCAVGKACGAAADCDSAVCINAQCRPSGCADGVKDGNESDVDCGGSCRPCPAPGACAVAADCASKVCTAGACVAASCTDLVANGSETDIDCGGSCATKCAVGKLCGASADCASAVCTNGTCRSAGCSDGVKDGTETDVDCGGNCAPCPAGAACTSGTDCASTVCTSSACVAASCTDTIKNGTETGVDCGGSCPSCAVGGGCRLAADCTSAVCLNAACQPSGCSDQIKDGTETDIDCGGTCTTRCSDNHRCAVAADCVSALCGPTNLCTPPTCTDRVRNGGESDVDCGGPCSAKCADSRSCFTSADCTSTFCDTDHVCKNSIASGLQAYWKFEADGTDSTGHGNTLTVAPVTTAANFVAGKMGEAFSQNQASSFQCANCLAFTAPNNGYLDFKPGSSSDFTVSLWVNRSANANVDTTWGTYGLFDNDQVSLNASANGQPSPSPAYAEVALFNAGTLVAKVNGPSLNFRGSSNLWVHLVVFARGTTLGIRVNNVETTTTFTGSVGPAGAFRMGENGSGYNWQGKFDEVAKWNRALTSAEMDELYNSGLGRAYPWQENCGCGGSNTCCLDGLCGAILTVNLNQDDGSAPDHQALMAVAAGLPNTPMGEDYPTVLNSEGLKTWYSIDNYISTPPAVTVPFSKCLAPGPYVLQFWDRFGGGGSFDNGIPPNVTYVWEIGFSTQLVTLVTGDSNTLGADVVHTNVPSVGSFYGAWTNWSYGPCAGAVDCPAGMACDGALCRDLAYDIRNCGALGNVCQAQACCANSCVDTGTDATNCGACNHPCLTGHACLAGACQ